ncbi:hypothetical protein C8F04DRAFT_1111293 [Mycena alexandri]|uniref:Uncharacterized protein n=1 Tax=Mycena alexandri TaxID=1745969 RepID=A0AAD6X0G2_9AGAR|nr:hypothetical protein C8F04DRAFT_1111293 [Mycena alexandri]
MQYHDFCFFTDDSRPDWYFESMARVRRTARVGFVITPKEIRTKANSPLVDFFYVSSPSPILFLLAHFLPLLRSSCFVRRECTRLWGRVHLAGTLLRFWTDPSASSPRSCHAARAEFCANSPLRLRTAARSRSPLSAHFSLLFSDSVPLQAAVLM